MGFFSSKRVIPFAIVALIVTTAIAGVSGTYMSRQPSTGIQVIVNGTYDPDNIGSATMLNVTVRNQNSQPVQPVFFVKWNWLANIWLTRNGPNVVNAKTDGSYLLQATDALAAIPRGDSFRLIVSNKLHNELVAESDPVFARTQPTPVVNPSFKWWTIDEAKGVKAPYGWQVNLRNNDFLSSGVVPLTSNDSAGVLAKLNYTGIGKAPSEITMSQKLLMNSTNLNLQVENMLTSNPNTDTLFGVSVTDGTHMLYYVFSETTVKTSTLIYPDNTTIIVGNTPRLQWNTIRLHIQSDWANQAWIIPEQVTISLFIRTASTGIFYAGISQINSST
jgi:hypothetical protein